MQTKTSVFEGVGVEAAPDFETTCKTAQLDWDVVSAPVRLPDGREFPRKKLLIRSDNGDPLGVVGHRYTPTTPRQFLERQFQLAADLGGRVTRVGFLPSKSRVFSTISLGEFHIPVQGRSIGDPVRCYIYTMDGWDGSTPIESRLYVERLVCLNGATSRRLESSIWISHTLNMESRWCQRVEAFKQRIQEGIDRVRSVLGVLASTPMDEQEASDFFKKLLPGDSTHTNNTRQTLLSLYRHGTGNEGRTRYDAFNAVTEYETHLRGFRVPETRIAERRFLRVMGDNPLRERAYSLLLGTEHLAGNN